jgi:hypothetical protein
MSVILVGGKEAFVNDAEKHNRIEIMNVFILLLFD